MESAHMHGRAGRRRTAPDTRTPTTDDRAHGETLATAHAARDYRDRRDRRDAAAGRDHPDHRDAAADRDRRSTHDDRGRPDVLTRADRAAARSRRLRGMLHVGLVVGGVGAAIPWWADWPPTLPAAFWTMAALALAVDARPHPASRRPARAVVLPSVCFTFAVVLAWGLLPALAVQAVTAAIAGARAARPVRRTAHLMVQYAAALGAAAAVAQMGGLRLPLDAVRWTDALLVFAAAVAWTLTRAVTAKVIARLVAEPTPRDPAGGGRARVELPTTGAMLLLGAVLPAVAAASAALVPLVLVPLFAVDRMARTTREHARASRTDLLTGLPNRRALLAAAHRLGRSRRGALLLFDLDRFKDVNDALGQPGGDRLLTVVADRLAAAVAPHDVVARLGGDEFAVLATRVDDAADARLLARHLASVLDQPVTINGLPVDVSAAVGVALHPEHGDDVAALLQHAEIAMYEAKQRGESCAVYAPAADGAPQRLALLADLRAALQDDAGAGTIALWYQPQVTIATGEVLGVEALLRWRHPERGMVDPEEILRVAEQTAVMRLLTAKVVADAVAQTARWRADGHLVRVAVNVSVRDLHTGDLAGQVEDLLDHYDVSATLLQVELTESALLTDARQVLATIGRLHRIGVGISLDDFGTGWSSLQHLRRLPLSEVKIDRSFVLGMIANPEDAAIVRSVVELADALKLRVVAEGVEDERTWRALHAAGCHSAQGWFYARPMPADEFVTWLSRYRPVSPAGPAPAPPAAAVPPPATPGTVVAVPLPARGSAAVTTPGGTAPASTEPAAPSAASRSDPSRSVASRSVAVRSPAAPEPVSGPVTPPMAVNGVPTAPAPLSTLPEALASVTPRPEAPTPRPEAPTPRPEAPIPRLEAPAPRLEASAATSRSSGRASAAVSSPSVSASASSSGSGGGQGRTSGPRPSIDLADLEVPLPGMPEPALRRAAPPTDAAAGHDAVTPAPDATAGGTAGPTPQADPEPTLELAPELEAPMLPPFMPLPPHERPGNRAGASRVDDAAAQRNA